jgi:hypothetical protein
MSEHKELPDDADVDPWRLREAEDMLEELARRGAVEIIVDEDGVKRYRMLPEWRQRLELE